VPAAVLFAQVFRARDDCARNGDDEIVIVPFAIGDEPAKTGGFKVRNIHISVGATLVVALVYQFSRN
jgi:hypothetical protein